MPRAETQTTITNRWVRENESWLGPDHRPLVQQLRMLARTMDTDMAEKNRIVSSHASAYTKAYQALLAAKSFDDAPPAPGGGRPAVDAADQDDDLLSPSGH